MPVVRIKVEQTDAKVFSPFECRDLIKSMPVRSWSSTGKYWSIPVHDVDDLQAALEEAGYHVVVIREAQQQRQQYEPLSNNGQSSGGTWADDMFITLGPQLADKAYKALVKVVHPDLGGSTHAMQVLNAARDRHGSSR